MSKKNKLNLAKSNTMNQKTKSRRNFLKNAGTSSLILSTLGLVACGGGGSSTTNSSSSSNSSVLILGAGAAGLSAAIALKKQGHSVTMLEYQNRIGGRLWSKAMLGGQFTELGAGHFSYSMPLVNSLVDRYSLRRITINNGNPRYIMNGVEGNANNVQWPAAWGLNEIEQTNSIEQNSTLAATVFLYLDSAGININEVLDSAWPRAAAVAQFGNTTIRQLLESQGASQGFIKLLNVHLGVPIADGDVLSGISNLVYFLNENAFYRLRDGNEQLAVKMADEFGRSNIHLNSIVVGIDQTGSQVKVTTSDGRTFQADKVISTIPFKVLTDVNVQPSWSAGKNRLLFSSEGLQWIDGFKGIVQTQTPSWIRQGNYGWPMAATDQGWNRVIDISGNQSGGYGNLFFYIYPVEKLAQLKAITGPNKIQDRTNLLLGQFNSTTGFTNNLINLNQVVLKDSIMWSGDPGETAVPWIKSALAVGVKPWMRDEWSIPEGRIHFAGDFTSYKSGWVEGALESGLRAASEIDPKATYF